MEPIILQDGDATYVDGRDCIYDLNNAAEHLLNGGRLIAVEYPNYGAEETNGALFPDEQEMGQEIFDGDSFQCYSRKLSNQFTPEIVRLAYAKDWLRCYERFILLKDEPIENTAIKPHDYLTELQIALAEGPKPTVQFWQSIYRALTYGESLSSVLGSEYTNALYRLMPQVNEVREYLLETGVEIECPDRTYFMLEEMRNRADEQMKATPVLRVMHPHGSSLNAA